MAAVRIDEALSSQPGRLIQLASALMQSGEGAKAVAMLDAVLAKAPDDPVLRELAEAVFTQGVPNFHKSMLFDRERNVAFDRAIRSAVFPGATVLDIGAGSGLLAMMAARAGAGRVIACEANTALAATARQIVAANGCSDRVTVLASHSTDLDPTADLGGGADVVVSEIFSENVIGEGAIAALNDAMTRLAKPGAHIVPAAASACIALADFSGTIPEAVHEVEGFDLSLFNRHISRRLNVAIGAKSLTLRSEPAELFRFDFTGGSAPLEGSGDLLLASSGGTVGGIVQWMSLQLSDDLVLENAPAPGRTSHWPCVFHPFAEKIDTAPGQEIAVHGWHDRTRLQIWRQA